MRFSLPNIHQGACALLLTAALVPLGQAAEPQAKPASTPEVIPVEVTAAPAVSEKEVGKGTVEYQEYGPVDKRMKIEQLTRDSRFLLTPYKRNYLLPVNYHSTPNNAPYLNGEASITDLNNTEVEIQFSIKVLLRENIFGDNGHLYIGYTNHAFWQLYSRKDSAPFRETNHEPEVILSFDSNYNVMGFRNITNEIIFNHQSNGQGEMLSRSWNRVMLRSIFERGKLAFLLTPWWRIPESEKTSATDPDGDDNPDITDYMGHFELRGAYAHKKNIYSAMVRNNFSHSLGALELGWTFPMTRNLRGYARYFDGYGYSLIDYNSRQQVISLGIAFTDIF